MLMSLRLQSPTEEKESNSSYQIRKDVEYDLIPRAGEKIWIDDQFLVVESIWHTPLLKDRTGNPAVEVHISTDLEILQALEKEDGWGQDA